MSQLALSLIEECIRTQNPYLDLGCCGLTDALVAEGTPIDIALRQCTHLKTLILSNMWWEWKKQEWINSQNIGRKNFFTVHPLALSMLNQLQNLRCSGGNEEEDRWQIFDISFVANMKELRFLDISWNQITEINNLDSLTNLQQLYIAWNQISEIKGLDALYQLQQLDISGNKIIEINVLDCIIQLQQLDIRNNQISELKGLDALPQLQQLYISFNKITELKGLDNLVHLQTFDISSNQISELKGLDNLANLQTFYIHSNKISELKGLDNLANLRTFSISSNQIFELKGLDNLANLRTFSISSNQISELKGLDNLANLQTFYIHSNKITELKGLDNLANLQTFNIHSNQISELKGLDNLANLQTFNIHSNQISELKGLDNLANLQTFDISSNQISELKGLDNLANLRTFSISSNQISELKGLDNLANLQTFYIHSNKITELKGLDNLANLQTFNIHSNQISELKGLDNLANLQTFNIHSNQISELKGLDNLANLQTFDISSNQISELKGLDNLANLQTFYIHSNKISELKGLDNLANLQTFYIHSNKISELKGLDNLANLQTFYIHSNKISELKGLDNLANLQTFYIHSNQISELKGLANLANLQTFYIHSNKISELKGLDNLANLQTFYIHSNKISELKGLDNLANLQTFSISSNQISDIRPLLPFIQKETNSLQIVWKDDKTREFIKPYEINVKDNPFTIPPMEIVEQGNEAIIRYFERKENGAKEIYLYEAKTVLVGEGGTGKTTLRLKLSDSKAKMPPKNARTRGIDVSPYQFDYNGHDYTAHVWDFGGQDIYYAIHRFFMSDNAVYVLMAQSRTDTHNFDYWLPNIQLFAGKDNAILVVRNLIKGFKGENMSLGEYKANFKICGDLFEIDLSKTTYSEALSALQTELHHQIDLLPQIRKPIFENWLEVRNHLKKTAKKDFHISYTQFVKICGLYDVTGLDVLDLGRYLHNLGILLWYHDKEKLKDMLILEPTWATSGVYKIIDDAEITKHFGRFTQEDLDRIWKKQAYCDRKGELLELMKNFKLCYERRDEKGCYIIPARLSAEMPVIAQAWDKTGAVVISYHYNFMPKGIVNQLTAQLHEYIQNDDHAWNKGIVLHYGMGQSQAFIKEDTIRRTIEVQVKGVFALGFLHIIMREMGYIHKDYPGIEFDLLLPCPCNKCKTLFKPTEFKYEDLMRWINEDPNKEVYCNESGTMLRASVLLSGIGIETQKEREREKGRFEGEPFHSEKEKPLIIQNFHGSFSPEAEAKIHEMHSTLSTLQSSLFAKIDIQSTTIQAAISSSSEKQLQQMEKMLQEINGMSIETQAQLWDGFSLLAQRNQAIKTFVEKVEAERVARQIEDSANVKLKIGLPFMIKEILGVGVEYETTLADGKTFFEWFKKWQGIVL